MAMQAPALPIAQTEVPANEPHLLGLDPEGWVYVGLTIFLLIAIFVAKAPKRITAALDQRIADTRRELDEAKAVRAEAEKLLAEAHARQAEAATDASAILAHAETEARALIAKVESDVATLIERRERMAEDRIAAAERQAIAEVRSQTATLAAVAAEHLIRNRHDAEADKALVDKAIAGLGQR
jgi:F-type H+-transporting ATPase subunit b